MSRIPIEQVVQSYLIANNGKTLKKLNKKLNFIEEEHNIPGGRIDILCEEKNWFNTKTIAIELKAQNYSTSYAIGQLTKYLNYADQVYFLAPKVKKQIYEQLKKPYQQNKLKLIEYKIKPQKGFLFKEMSPRQLKDERQIPWMDELLKKEERIHKIKKGLNLKDKNSIRAAMEIIYYLEDYAKNKGKRIGTKKNIQKDIALLGTKVLSNYDNNTGIKIISKALEIYAKI
ncbi:endonuclease NucS [Candidatus Woesearchaeota archaeon]|nr:endonuclease NucS [Candidatus Woesearchaeota archaeon]MCF7901639.1 endonuclease NucS [Candidatus Woesearchaeota archaeon]MCF8013257.1 endonuclease NucS [Candidatus Woesearchaeota archaeon]